MEQRTEEWHRSRLGYVTASRFKDVMREPRSKSAVLAQSAISYQRELRSDHLSGKPRPELTTKAIQHGHEYEPAGRDRYEQITGASVALVGFLTLPGETMIGGSPDGLVGEDGLIEIKCPQNRDVMEKYRDGEFADTSSPNHNHVPQMQGLLWITGRKWCDFIAYHPDYGPQFDIAIHRVHRDDEYIERLAKKVIAFRDLLKQSILEVCQRVHSRTAAKTAHHSPAA